MTSPIQDYCLIPLTQGQFAKVSPHRFEELNQWKWFAQWNKATRSFYARRNAMIDGKQSAIFMHRVILGLPHGDKREGDHVSHDTLDDRDGNLRMATSEQNAMNRRLFNSNRSGFKGVYRKKNGHGTRHRFTAQIRVRKQLKTLGSFPDTPDGMTAAAKRYDEAAREFFGEFAHLNFP